jgi:hypothetical protein
MFRKSRGDAYGGGEMRGTVEGRRVVAALRTRRECRLQTSTNIPRALSKQRIACGFSMGAQKLFLEFSERRRSQMDHFPPESVHEGFTSPDRGLEMRCAGRRFRGQILAFDDVIWSHLHTNLHAFRERLKVSRLQG